MLDGDATSVSAMALMVAASEELHAMIG